MQIGYFLRMLLLRNRLEESDSFATLAQREMNTLTGAIEHCILPLQDVIKVSDLPRAPGRTPAWQASITWDEEGNAEPLLQNSLIAKFRNYCHNFSIFICKDASSAHILFFSIL